MIRRSFRSTGSTTRSAVGQRKYPPGPYNFFAPMGMTVRHMLRLWWNPLPFLDGLRRYGDLSFFRMFGVRAYVVNHPDLIHQVLVTDRQSFRKLPHDTRTIRQLLGDGILVSDGDQWLRQRRLVQPAFHPSRFARYADDVVQQTNRLIRSWNVGSEVEIAEEMTDLTLKIAAKTMFDVSLDDEHRRLADAARVLSEQFISEIHNVFTLPDWLPTVKKRRKRAAMGEVDRFLTRAIAERRAGGEDRGDLLSMLLLAVDDIGDGRGMTDKQARDEAMTIFTAAFHANSMALTWTWMLLAQHPAVALRMHQEIDHVLGDGDATYEDVAQLAYTQMVLQESMRLYPPAWALFCRQAVRDVELRGYGVRRGSWVFLYPYVTHRDPRFFPNPERFDPERFSARNEPQVPRYAYFPFGAGPRQCIGNVFAMVEMTLILATIARRFRLSLADPDKPIIAQASLALRPRHGLPMRLENRTPSDPSDRESARAPRSAARL